MAGTRREQTMIITSELVESFRTKRGGFSSQVLHILTGERQPRTGWCQRLLGIEISDYALKEIRAQNVKRDGQFRIKKPKHEHDPEIILGHAALDAEFKAIIGDVTPMVAKKERLCWRPDETPEQIDIRIASNWPAGIQRDFNYPVTHARCVFYVIDGRRLNDDEARTYVAAFEAEFV